MMVRPVSTASGKDACFIIPLHNTTTETRKSGFTPPALQSWSFVMTIAALVEGGPLRMGAIGPAVTAVQVALRNDGRDIQPRSRDRDDYADRPEDLRG